ncbi:Fumarate hydratase class I, aerobic, partial [Frankliniella fusca]
MTLPDGPRLTDGRPDDGDAHGAALGQQDVLGELLGERVRVGVAAEQPGGEVPQRVRVRVPHHGDDVVRVAAGGVHALAHLVPQRAVAVGRGHVHHGPERAHVAAQLQHAPGAQDVDVDGRGQRRVEVDGGRGVEDDADVAEEVGAVLGGQAEPREADVARHGPHAVQRRAAVAGEQLTREAGDDELVVVLTGLSSSWRTRAWMSLPPLGRTSRYTRDSPGQDRSSFSTSTPPRKPVPPVTRTAAPSRSSPMVGVPGAGESLPGGAGGAMLDDILAEVCSNNIGHTIIMECSRLLALVLAVVAAVLLQQHQARAQEVEQCPCADPNLAFCLPRGGVLLQRFAAATPLCESKDQACVDGQLLQHGLCGQVSGATPLGEAPLSTLWGLLCGTSTVTNYQIVAKMRAGSVMPSSVVMSSRAAAFMAALSLAAAPATVTSSAPASTTVTSTACSFRGSDLLLGGGLRSGDLLGGGLLGGDLLGGVTATRRA